VFRHCSNDPSGDLFGAVGSGSGFNSGRWLAPELATDLGPQAGGVGRIESTAAHHDAIDRDTTATVHRTTSS
jgi:hypothetical protein